MALSCGVVEPVRFNMPSILLTQVRRAEAKRVSKSTSTQFRVRKSKKVRNFVEFPKWMKNTGKTEVKCQVVAGLAKRKFQN